jgi:sugar phosphate permease
MPHLHYQWLLTIPPGVFHGMDDLAGIAGWKWLFILQGLITAVIGVIGWFVLPDYPKTTRWLTPAERELAYNRVELDTTDNAGETSVWMGLRQAVSDPMVWLFALMAHLHRKSRHPASFESIKR